MCVSTASLNFASFLVEVSISSFVQALCIALRILSHFSFGALNIESVKPFDKLSRSLLGIVKYVLECIVFPFNMVAGCTSYVWLSCLELHE